LDSTSGDFEGNRAAVFDARSALQPINLLVVAESPHNYPVYGDDRRRFGAPPQSCGHLF